MLRNLQVELARYPEIQGALASGRPVLVADVGRDPLYEQERLPMTAQIVRMNRKGGPEGVIDAVEARAPDGFTSIDDVLSFEERQAIVRGYASTAGFAREQVNKAA